MKYRSGERYSGHALLNDGRRRSVRFSEEALLYLETVGALRGQATEGDAAKRVGELLKSGFFSEADVTLATGYNQTPNPEADEIRQRLASERADMVATLGGLPWAEESALGAPNDDELVPDYTEAGYVAPSTLQGLRYKDSRGITRWAQ